MNTSGTWIESISLLNKEEIRNRAQKQIIAFQEELLSNNKSESIILKETLALHQGYLRNLNTHYDFELWYETEENFEQLWPDLLKSLNLAIEYGLYDLVKDIFFEIRHLLQTTGHIKDRIYLATWIKNQAEKRQDIVGENLSLSSLVWSYTSAGKHQDLKQANIVWKSLAPFLEKIGTPFDHNKYRESLLKEIGPSLYIETLMDIFEGGTRLAVRQQKFRAANKYISQGREEISVFAREGYLSERLKERFDLAFSYHEGVAFYLKGQHEKAHRKFDAVISQGERISWIRAIRGAKSWLATLAIERKAYTECEAILQEITHEHPAVLRKRDGMCHLIKAQLLNERGRKTEKIESEQMACLAFAPFTTDSNDQTPFNTCNLNLVSLYRLFSLAPCLAQ